MYMYVFIYKYVYVYICIYMCVYVDTGMCSWEKSKIAKAVLPLNNPRSLPIFLSLIAFLSHRNP